MNQPDQAEPIVIDIFSPLAPDNDDRAWPVTNVMSHFFASHPVVCAVCRSEISSPDEIAAIADIRGVGEDVYRVACARWVAADGFRVRIARANVGLTL